MDRQIRRWLQRPIDRPDLDFGRGLGANLFYCSMKELIEYLCLAKERGDRESVTHLENVIKANPCDYLTRKKEKLQILLEEGMKVGSKIRNGDLMGTVNGIDTGKLKILFSMKVPNGIRSNWISVCSVELVHE